MVNEVSVSGVIGAGADAHRLVKRGPWTFTIWETGDGEPRIRDLDAGQRLGFARPITIRDLIKRVWRGEKRKDIHQIRTAGTFADGRPAKPATEFWLTEAQLLKLCARSETPIAEAILDDMIAVYIAVRLKLLRPIVAVEPPPAALGSTLALVQARLDEHERKLAQLAATPSAPPLALSEVVRYRERCALLAAALRSERARVTRTTEEREALQNQVGECYWDDIIARWDALLSVAQDFLDRETTGDPAPRDDLQSGPAKAVTAADAAVRAARAQRQAALEARFKK